VIVNSRIGALIGARASNLWMCVPRFEPRRRYLNASVAASSVGASIAAGWGCLSDIAVREAR